MKVLLLKKNGIPVAEIKKPANFSISNQLYVKILESTKSTWTNEPIDKKRQVQQRKLELQAARKRRKLW